MKDSKTIRNEHQSFVDAWKKIQEDNSSTPVAEGSKNLKDMIKTNKKGYKVEKVLVRKSGAFTALAEKYNMSPKQFGRYVEANQHLFDIPTRKKAILANKFQGFKETKEWDEFFGDLELVESKAPYIVHTADMKGNTPAWQGYVEGKLNEVTGEPLYVAGEDLQKNEGFLDFIKTGFNKNRQKNIKDGTHHTTDYNGKKEQDGTIFSNVSKRNKVLNNLQNNSNELEGEDLQEITTKETKSGTKFKVRVKDKKTNSSYIRFATRDKIAQLRSDPKIASVEMTDEGQTPEERGEKKAQAAGGGSLKKAKKDYDGDGKVETGSQEYLGSRDKAIKKAMKKRSVTTEKYMPSNPQFVGVGANKKYKESDSGTTSYGHINSTKTGFMKGGAYSSKFGKDNPIGKSETERTKMGLEQKKKIDAMKPIVKSSHELEGDQLDEINAGPATSKMIPPVKVKVEPDYSGLSKAQIMAKKRIAAKKAGTYTKPKTAQELAKARIGSGTAKNPDTKIQDVKDANTASMKAKAAERFKAFKARRMAKEELSDWREDLKEIMGEVEKTEGKKSKSKKKNGICINPDTDDEKNKYEEVKPMTSVTGDGSKLSPRHAPGGDLSQYNKDGTKKTPLINKKRGTAFIKAQEAAESLGAELQSLKIEDADGNVAYEVVDLVKPDPIKENKVMLTYNSNRDKKIDFNVGGVSNVRANIDKGRKIVSKIKNDGLVNTVKNTINNNNSNNNSTSVSDKVSSAINKYKSTISSSYEMETEENIVTKAIDKVKNIGSSILKKYQETEAKKKQFRDNNPGGTVSKSTYQQSVKDGTSSQY